MLVRTAPVLDGDPSAVVRRVTTPGRTSAPVEADDDDRGLAVFGPPPVVEEGIPGTVTGDGVDLSVETTAEAVGRPPRGRPAVTAWPVGRHGVRDGHRGPGLSRRRAQTRRTRRE
jgi:hypothetical protein